MTVAHDSEVITIEKNEVYEVDSDKYVFLAREPKRETEKPCNFEDAIELVGFGKFNIILYLVATTTGLATVFDSISLSYVMADIKCDLDLTLTEEGILNSVTIVGMVTTGLFWGYISDTIGRRKLLLHILMFDFMFSFFAALSRNFILLVVFNFLAGAVTSGAYAALASYLTEMHCRKHRVIVQLFIGFLFGFAELLLPLLAMLLLANGEPYRIIEEFDLLPWNFFLLVCCLAPLLSTLGFFLLPESPKFLLSKGKDEEALEILKCMYRFNSYNASPYPVTYLENEISLENQSLLGNRKYENPVCEMCHQFCNQFRLIFTSEYMTNITLTSGIQFMILMGLDAYKLWMPQLFHQIVQQEASGQSTGVCDALDILYHENSTSTSKKVPHLHKEYLYCTIVASATLLVFFLSSAAVKGIGKKHLLFFLGYNSGLAVIVITFSKDIPVTIALSSIILPFGNISFNALISVVIVLFPTNLRAMSVAMTMSFGRLGGALGCFIFPLFLSLGCAAPFIFIGSIMITWSLLVTILPNTDSNILE